jgi:hypothetical protein
MQGGTSDDINAPDFFDLDVLGSARGIIED